MTPNFLLEYIILTCQSPHHDDFPSRRPSLTPNLIDNTMSEPSSFSSIVSNQPLMRTLKSHTTSATSNGYPKNVRKVFEQQASNK